MKKKALLGVIVLIAIGIGIAYWLVWGRGPTSKNVLRLSGHMEATQTDLAFKVSEQIIAIQFNEGDWIKTGDKVAELDPKALKDDVAQATAKLAQTQANLSKMLAGYRPQEVREARENVNKAQADLYNKSLNYSRQENLLKRKVVSTSTRDQAEADYRMAVATLKYAQEQYDLMKEGYRKEDIDAARADYEQAKAALELARTRLGYATISSPVDGVVLAKPAEVGEVAAVGATVVTLGLLDDVWFEGYIPETDLAKVRYGMKAYVTTDAYPGKKYPAWVSFINSKAEFTPKTVETYKERVTLVYRTKIRAGNPEHELKPGMPAEAVVLLDTGQQ